MLTLTNERLAEIVSKKIKPDGHVSWYPSDLPAVAAALRAMKFTSDADSYEADPKMPWWLYTALVAGLAPKPVTVHDFRRGPMTIPCNTPDGNGSDLFEFRTYEGPQYTLVTFAIDGWISHEQLNELFPPLVNPHKGVIISAEAPAWVLSTLSVAYAQAAAWVASTQLDKNTIVTISNTKGRIVGSEIDRLEVEDTLEEALKSARPKRGEIWFFDNGYGRHPGVIMSPERRNATSVDVLLVPMTTQDEYSDRHLFAPSSETGTGRDSFAQYSNLSLVRKERLISRKSRASDSFMTILTELVQASV
jgi:mRNA-degrading endonuclease toxin of MazEF toxin-antitoxin module